MKSVEFCYWLQGVFEIADPKALDEKQTEVIKQHLAMVFVHEIDPSYPANHQKELNDLHNGVEAPGAQPKKPVMRC
jgi:hypothetical protein